MLLGYNNSKRTLRCEYEPGRHICGQAGKYRDRLIESFAIGVRGYFYRQVTGDSGSGAVLGDFKGEAFGVGPGFVWLPKFAEGKLVAQGKWMTDVHSENRFDSDYTTLTISWTF